MVPGDMLEASVPDLDEGKEYEFRVIACNDGGYGKPSDATKSLLVKATRGKHLLQVNVSVYVHLFKDESIVA